MIKILANKGGKNFIIIINNKVVKYWDEFEGKIWGGPLQWLPPSKETARKIVMSRNKIPAYFLDMLFVPADELAEWQNAKDDNEVFKLIKRDLIRNSCKIEKIATTDELLGKKEKYMILDTLKNGSINT